MQVNRSRLQQTREALAAIDASRSSITSLDPSLSSLTKNNIDILDKIIFKSPDATSFTTVFKAYSDVLQQHGLDPSSDVLYYKQLLKLGVVKGATWKDKWQTVKEKLRISVNSQARSPILRASLVESLQEEDDVFTSTTKSQVEEMTTVVAPRSSWMKADPDHTRFDMVHSTPRRHQPQVSSSSSSRDTLDAVHLPSKPHIPPETPVLASQRHQQVRALYRRPSVHRVVPDRPSKDAKLDPANDANTWKKIRKAQDFTEADRFRNESLFFICFQTWKAGLQWICSTHNQISEARDLLLLQAHFKRWKIKVVVQRNRMNQAFTVNDGLVLKSHFRRWKKTTYRRRTEKWKDSMRRKAAQIKRLLDNHRIAHAWMEWRHGYLSRQLSRRRLLAMVFRQWRMKLNKLQDLQRLADQFEDALAERILGDVLDVWMRRIHMRDAERYLIANRNRNTLTSSFIIWTRNMVDLHCADAFNARVTIQHVMRNWRRVRVNKATLEVKAKKYEKRRDSLLLRAIIRVWVARERGLLLERIRTIRLSRSALVIWCNRLTNHKTMQDSAIVYSHCVLNRLMIACFGNWRQRQQNFLRQYNLADQYHKANLLYRALLVWRLRLRVHLRLHRKGKTARKYFLERQAWEKWRSVLKRCQRERMLVSFQKAKLRRHFSEWLQIFRTRRQEEASLIMIQHGSNRLLLKRALERWTDRVVILRLREIDTVEHRDFNQLCTSFAKWKDVCMLHVEKMSLLDSFLDVKREDTLRRVFTKWLNNARKTRARRLRLAEHEEELRLDILLATWEIWRDRFRENCLRETECEILLQTQHNALYHTFMIWFRKTKSLPAIRSYAGNLKFKSWKRWRTTLPTAIQTRKARGMYNKRLMSMVFTTWKQIYKTKIALKAVARARQLRLPSPSYKGSNTSATRLKEPPMLRSRVSGLLSSHPSTFEKDVKQVKENTTHPVPGKRRLSNLLPSNLRTERDSSKTSAYAGNPNKLWSELRSVQCHDRSELI